MSDATVTEENSTVDIQTEISTVTVSQVETPVSITEVSDSITITQLASASIEVASTGIAGPKGEKGDAGGSDESTVADAGLAPIFNIVYTSGLPTLITYDDTPDFANHTKTIAYTSGLPTEITEVFDYNSQTWTVTKTITYVSGLPDSTTFNIVKS